MHAWASALASQRPRLRVRGLQASLQPRRRRLRLLQVRSKVQAQEQVHQPLHPLRAPAAHLQPWLAQGQSRQ